MSENPRFCPSSPLTVKVWLDESSLVGYCVALDVVLVVVLGSLVLVVVLGSVVLGSVLAVVLG